MKKITLLLSLLLIQQITSQIKIGYTIGASSFSMDSNFYESKSRIGLDVGSHLRYIINERSEILTDFIISFAGSQIEGAPFSDEFNRQYYKFKQMSFIYGAYYNFYILPEKFSVFLGPSFVFSQGLKLKGDDFGDFGFGKYNVMGSTIEENENILNLSTGITAGVNNIKLMLKYTYGLTNAYASVPVQDPNTFESIEATGKTSYLSISLMYSIDYNQ